MIESNDQVNALPDESKPAPFRVSRRQMLRGSAALGVGVVASGAMLHLRVNAQGTPATSGEATDSSGVIGQVTAAGHAFLATLTDDEKSAVLFDFSDMEQRQRWSNLPEGGFERAGLMWGNMTDAAKDAWLALMQTTLSEQGYTRVLAQWAADDALASGSGGGGGAPGGDGGPPNSGGTPPDGGGPGGDSGNGGPGGGGGGGLQYGMQYYWVALIGEPSETDPWQWQWGGHHVTINATVGGGNIALTPSFIGVQPATYTDADGNTVRPLGDIDDTAFELVNALTDDQKQVAILGSEYIDLVLGPGQDGKVLQPEGLLASELDDAQQALLVQLIGYYTGLIDDELAAGRLAEVTDVLDQTYFVWYGPTEQGSASYFRVAGPTIVIEYSPQSMGGDAADHIHGIYRDPSNDYGVRYIG